MLLEATIPGAEDRYQAQPETDGPLVSIITIVRNNRHGIERTIRSVLDQTYRQTEYIVVDGASTDGTLEVIHDHSSDIAVCVSEPDRGIAHALNKGARLASGDLLLFLNAGDSFVDEEALARAIELIPAGSDLRQTIFYGDAQYIHASGTSLLRTSHETLGEDNTLCHPSALIGASIQKALEYDERLVVFMDYDLWLRCRGRFSFVKLPLVISTFASGGISAVGDRDGRLPVERAVVQLVNQELAPDSRSIARVLARVLFFSAKRKLRRQIGDKAFGRLRRVLRRTEPAAWEPPRGSAREDVET
jgi:glycosyltransferase involved in cell wall biosynthesis